MYILTKGQIITPTKVLTNFDVWIEDKIITSICETNALNYPPHAQVIDVQQGFIMPGFIDIHSDYIEKMAAPRPQSVMDFKLAIYEAERELLTHGVTTMYHSLSVYGKDVFSSNPIRKRENVAKLINLIEEINEQSRLIHHRLHLRFEIDSIDHYEMVTNFIKQNKVHLLSFMDHTPEQGQYNDLTIYRKTLMGYHQDNVKKVEEIIAYHEQKKVLSWEQLETLAELAKAHHVPIASHDDDTLAKLDLVTQLHATITEFPITLEIAQAAAARGMYTLVGAPNILLGKSHSGNLSALDGIKHNAVSMLCSDYFPAALIHAVYKLVKTEILSWPAAVRLITANPATALGIDAYTGSLAAGKTADIIVVRILEEEIPVVAKTFVKGELVNETNYRV